MMKLAHLKIKNLKLLKDFELSFLNTHGTPRQWTLLVARNGRGKSTVLQAIALACAGQTIASALIEGEVQSLHDRREERPSPVEIEATFALSELGAELGLKPHPKRDTGPGEPKALLAKLWLSHRDTFFAGESTYLRERDLAADPIVVGESTYSRAGGPADDPIEGVRRSPRPWWFVAGYGTNRALTVERRQVDRAVQQRLALLFSATTKPPVGLSFADTQIYPKLFVKTFVSLLQQALVGSQEHRGLAPLVSGLELRGAGGVDARSLAEKDKFTLDIPGSHGLRVPATYLSHGYQSTVAWIADLIGQFLLDFVDDEQTLNRIKLHSITGLVLVDELDLFLHPEWQTTFIDDLSATFPNLQFIATTHSPLLLANRRPEEVVLLDWNENGDIVPKPLEGDPRLMNTGELYRTVFGMNDVPPTSLAQTLADYNFLTRLTDRTPEEDGEAKDLAKTLEAAGIELPSSETS